VPDYCSSLISQRFELARSKEELQILYEAVDRPVDLPFSQWLQLYAMTLDFAPDLVIELGRGRGNSTCVFTTAVNHLDKGKVVSIGNESTRDWETLTMPRLVTSVSSQWFDRLSIVQNDVMNVDFSKVLGESKRTLLFWDVHGVEVAYWIIANIFPLLEKREHLIIVHDMTDTRYSDFDHSYNTEGPPFVWMGPISSSEPEIVPLYDFISRNNLGIHSPGNSVELYVQRQDASHDAKDWTALDDFWRGLPQGASISDSHWIYFDLVRDFTGAKLSFPERNLVRQGKRTPPEFWESLRRHRSNMEEMGRVHPENLSFKQLVFDKSGENLTLAWERTSYGTINNRDLAIEANEGPIFLSTTPQDHVCTPFLKVLGNSTGNWARIVFAYGGKVRPSRDCVLNLQDSTYSVFWSLPLSEVDITSGRHIGYANLEWKSAFRLTIMTLDGKPTYLPTSIRIDLANASY
jgi:hypothetical protein